MPVYTYYDYLENYYDSYYEHYYWPYYYGVYNVSNASYNGTYPPSPWKARYDMNIFNPVIGSIVFLCAILSIFILFFAFYKVWNLRRRDTIKKSTLIITMVCLLTHALQNTVDAVSFYAWFLDFDVNGIHNELYMAWDVLWCLAKVTLYVVFMWRYYSVFTHVSTFQRISRQRCVTFGLFIAGIMIQMILILTYMLFYYEMITGSFDNRRIYLSLCWSFLAGDIILISVLGYLLTRSIFKLVVSIDAHRASLQFTSPAGVATLHRAVGSISSIGSNPKEVSSKTEANLADYVEHVAESGQSDDVTSDAKKEETNTEKKEPEQKKRTKKEKRTQKQEQLIYTTTRLVLTCSISLVSSILYQVIWLVAEELYHDGLWLIGYTWCVDAVINMICVYLSMGMARHQYKCLCVDVCKCHQCTLRCVHRLIDYKADQKRKQLEQIEEATKKEIAMTVR